MKILFVFFVLFSLGAAAFYRRPKTCQRSHDCPVGHICGMGICLKSRPIPTVNTFMLGKACSTGADCDESSTCVDGVCVVDNGSGGLCSGDAWCPNGYTCVDSHCRVARRHFSEGHQCDPACPPNLACLWGRCVDAN